MLKVQCAALEPTSRLRYLSTQLKFSDWCDIAYMRWHSLSVGPWLTELQLGGKTKPVTETTLLQKVTHLNFLTDTTPPLLPGGKCSISKLLHGLGKFSDYKSVVNILPPSFLISLSLLEQPQKIHIAMQFQTAVGLRAGQMTMVARMHLLTKGYLICPPFKRRKHTVLLNIEHVPEWLIQALLSSSVNDYSPILCWTTPQYRARFQEVCKIYRLPNTSHAARHAYATIRRYLNDTYPMISQVLIHKGEKTLETYLHTLSAEEQAVIRANPAYFRTKKLISYKTKS